MKLSTDGLKLQPHTAVDLQMHTTFSDGHWEVEALLDYLVAEQFGLAAITDHDCVETAVTIQELAKKKGIHILVATEMTTRWQGQLVDLLCFGFDPVDNDLKQLAQDVLIRQQQNSQEVFLNLQKRGLNLPNDSLRAILNCPSSAQPHAFITLLKKHGYGNENPSGGKMLMEAGCSFKTNDPAAVVDAVHQSGGVCILAHPGRTDGFVTFDSDKLNLFRQEVPIDGLEAYYPAHTDNQTEMFQDYAKHHDLLMSAGSDSHDTSQPPIKYSAELCSTLLQRVGIEIG